MTLLRTVLGACMLVALATALVLADALGGPVVALVVGLVGALGVFSAVRGDADPALVGGILTARVARRLRPTPPR